MIRKAAAVGLLVCTLGAKCASQQPEDIAEATLEELGRIKVYSASRHLQSGGEAPSSVTVITADEIAKHGYRTLADILQNLRGFFVTYDRNYSSVGVRGFARPGDFNTRLLLLIDGHRLNDNIYDEAMLGTEFPLDIDLIERIEVVRGPVSSLYGSNALFGVVNIISKRGGDLNGLEVSSAAGSFNTYKGRMSYGSRFSALEFLISGTFYGSRGHNQLFFPQFNTPFTNSGVASHADDDQVGSTFATLSFRDFTLQGVYGTREKGIPTGAYGTLFNNSGTRTSDAHDYVDLKYEHTFAGSWDVLARSFFDRYTYTGKYMYEAPLNPIQLFVSGKITPNYDHADGKWWGAELQITKTILARNRITLGGEFRDNIRQSQNNYNLSPYSLLLDDRRNSWVGAVFAQDELRISKSLSLNAGFRYDHYNRVQASTDPRAALLFRPRPQSAFKFIYGEAFRIPNVYEMYYSVPPMLANPALNPERIRTGELVWEEAITPHLWLTTSAFYTAMHGLITEVPVANEQLIFQNLQDTTSKGVEIEVRAEFPKGLEGKASYSFQQTRDGATHQLISNSPRGLAKGSLTQSLFRRKLFATLDGQYRSRIDSLDCGSVSPFTLLNATLLARNVRRGLDWSASLYNILDKTYFDPPSSANLQLPIQQDGRAFRVQMTWRIGER